MTPDPPASRNGDAPQRPPSVLLLVENHSVPADRRVWGEARSLARAGMTVSVVCPRGRHMDRDAFEMREGVAIYRYPMPFGGPRKIDFFLEYGWALLACLGLSLHVWRRRGLDVLHVANPPDFFFPLGKLFRLFGKRFIFDQHDLTPETYRSKFGETRGGLLLRVLSWAERASYRTSDAVVVTNTSYRDVCRTRGGVPEDRIFVVRNSPNPELFHPRPPRPELREGFAHLVVFVGVMGAQDGVDYLLRAAHHVAHDLGRRDILFAIVGTGDTWDTLQRLHRELDLAETVRFTGRIPDAPMLDYLATADVGVAPDPKNPLNDVSTMTKTMEFMAMGKPVVSFDLKESRASAGDAAVYVPDNDWRAFGQAIVDLVDDPERRRRMGEIGRQRILGELSWAHSERNLLRAYRSVLGDRVPQTRAMPATPDPVADSRHR